MDVVIVFVGAKYFSEGLFKFLLIHTTRFPFLDQGRSKVATIFTYNDVTWCMVVEMTH